MVAKFLNMLPTSSLLNKAYCAFRDTVFFGKYGIWNSFSRFPAYFQYLWRRKFACIDHFASNASPSIIPLSVVVKNCPKVKVVRPYARRVIAFVKNAHAFWDISVMDFPRKTVGLNHLFHAFHKTVSVIVNDSIPYPTIISLIKGFPKSLYWRYPLSFVGAKDATFCCSVNKWFSAIHALSVHDLLLSAFGYVEGVFARLVLHGKLILSRAIPRTATTVAGLLIILPQLAFSGEILLTKFCGLNTGENAAAIDDCEAQDLLNIDLCLGGVCAKKREGSGLHKTLSFSTSAVHGIYFFQDSSGSDIQLYANDIYIQASVNGASVVNLATITVNSTMQCTDNLGYAYCLTSSRNTCVRTDGTTSGTSFLPGPPKGTMITNTPDRLVVAGVSGSESTLYLSQANTFTNFTVGINTADPWTEVINAPGSRLTHIRYACGKLLWWKDGSFGYSVGSDQYNWENVTVSQNIGTLDNSSDEYNGHVYFRGQDNHIYDYDCSNLTRLSRKISPTVASSSRRRQNSWTQTSQSDFATGVGILSASFSTSLVPGEVTVSSFSDTDTTSSHFTQGTGSNITFQSGSIIISTNATNITNNGFEDGDHTGYTATTWGTVVGSLAGSGGSCSLTPQAGSYFSYGGGAGTVTAEVLDAISGAQLATTSFSWADNSCTWVQRTLSGLSSYVRRRAKIKFTTANGNLTSDSFILNGSNITFYSASTCSGAVCVVKATAFDTIEGGRSDITTANFTSRSFDSGISTNVASVLTNWTANTTTPYFEIQGSHNSADWLKIVSSSGTSGSGKRYLRYVSSFTVGTSDHALTTLDDATVIAKSTGGVFLSAVNNASGVTSWSNFTATDFTPAGSIAYYVRASTAIFTQQSSTPVWVSQSKNATVNYATGTYMQARMDWTVNSATTSISLSDFVFNWFEGNALDKAYIKYWNDYVWVAVSSGTTGLNNRIQRWDLLNQTWLLDDIPSNGFLVQNNDLYFGSPSEGKIFKYGNGVTTDNSGAISSYWKSKNFTGSDPFVQNTWNEQDFIVKAASPTVMSVVYQIDGATTTTSYNMNLFNATKTILHKGFNLSPKTGTFYNVRFGDNSSNPRFEIYGYRARYTPLPWRPE